MGDQAKLLVEKGPDAGKTVLVPEHGLRIGRSSRNDLALTDPSMSRFHCRVYATPGQGLYVADLGSANDTCVNGKPIQEVQLQIDDRIAVGQTVLRIIDDGMAAAVANAPSGGDEPVIDLGLRRDPIAIARAPGASHPRAGLRVALLGLLGIMVIVTLSMLIWRDLPREALPPTAAPPPPPLAIDIVYEKVEASPENIFRYFMTLKGLQLAVEIDDIANNRRVRKSDTVDDALIRDLAMAIEGAGFFELSQDYSGLATNVHDRSEILLTIGARTHRCVVFNRVAPDAFEQVRERLEILVQNQLGTAALALSPEQLREMAYQAYLLGRSLYDERSLRYDNLHRAIRAFREVEWYMETIEPKPDYFGDAVARRQQTERELQERFQNLEFLAERAIKGQDWQDAALHLRTILDTIPERSDERHRRTVTRLLDVERRIGRRL